MTENKIYAKGRFAMRSDTSAEWERVNPILAKGEPGFVTDTGLIKVGDGETAWNELEVHTSGVGQETAEGGEVFNDYENNTTGSRAFQVNALDKSQLTYTLDSVTGLAVGDIYTVNGDGWGNYENQGEITAISGNTVAVSNMNNEQRDSLIEGKPVYFRIAAKPEVGTVDWGGKYAHAENEKTSAQGNAAHAEGYNNTASGKYSHAEGRNTFAGFVAHSEGQGSEAPAAYSHAEGYGTKATGWGAHAEGFVDNNAFENSTEASGKGSHAEGFNTRAAAAGAHSEGGDTLANAPYAHAEGLSTKALEYGTHSEGANSEATGEYSHAEGKGSIASGEGSHSEGRGNAKGSYSHAEGDGIAEAFRAHAENSSTASASDAHAEGENTKASGSNAHSENYRTTASGFGSHAEGGVSTASASYAHAEGFDSHATGEQSHAEGRSTASGKASHAEGSSTASGDYSHAEGTSVANAGTSHAEGSGTTASGQGAHSGGTSSTAHGKDSITHGTGTISWYDNQATFGILNKNKNNTLLEIGNGTEESNRSNAFEVYKDGHAEVLLQGDTDNSVVTKSGLVAELEAKQDVLNAKGTYSIGELERISSIGTKVITEDTTYGKGERSIQSWAQLQAKMSFTSIDKVPAISFKGYYNDWVDMNPDAKLDLSEKDIWDYSQNYYTTGDILLTGIAEPTADNGAANKAYVDGLIATLTERISALETELAALKSGGES